MKKVILVLSISLIISTFGACKNSTVTESSSESATSKVVAVTTTSETESQIETSPYPISEKKLNSDLLSDTELTFSQLQEKYGELIDVFRESGGRYYKFENGIGAFGWPGEGDSVDYERGYFNLPRSEENKDLTSGKFPYPKSHIVCGYIIDLQATDIFIGLEQPATISEIEESYNIELEEVHLNVDEESGKYMGPIEYSNKDGEIFRYSAVFIYEGKSIIIEMLNEDLISLDSYVRIRYKLEDNATISETVAEKTAVTETTTEPMIEKKLNLDLLSDIGLTYGEIRAKHGDVKDFFKLSSGNFCYVFKQGYIGYLWDFDKVYKVENSDKNILLPNTEEECQSLLIFEAKDLFSGLNSSINSAELENIYNVTHISSGYNAHDDCYFSSFKLADKYFYIETKESEIITPSSSIQISLISN